MIGKVASNAADCIAVRREQAGRKEREVGHAAERCRAAAGVHVRAQADAHRRRGTAPAAEKLPKSEPRQRPDVEQPLVLEDARALASDERRRRPRRRWRSERRLGDGHHSISVRPVSRRKTSSSELRRTSTVSGRRPALVDGHGGRLAVVGVEQDPVRAASSMRSARPSSGRPASPGRRLEAQLHDLAGGVSLDELARRALGHDPRLVHDHQPVAQLLGLVHVVGGEDERHAAAA